MLSPMSGKGRLQRLTLNVALETKERPFLRDIRAAVDLSLLTAWSRCARVNSIPQEPDIVAALVLEGTPLIQRALDSLLPGGISSTVLGVYCHQSPYVQFDRRPEEQCELGDLLVCHFHMPGTGLQRLNALLLQAKISRPEPTRLRGDDLTQFELYSQWPAFTYLSKPLRGERRQVMPLAAHTGAQYLTIERKLPLVQGSPMRIAFPWNPLVSRGAFEQEFFRFVWGNTGRAFLPRALAVKDEWSQVVWDLIRSAAQKAFRRERIGAIKAPRLVKPGELDGLWTCRDHSYFSTQSRAIIRRRGRRLDCNTGWNSIRDSRAYGRRECCPFPHCREHSRSQRIGSTASSPIACRGAASFDSRAAAHRGTFQPIPASGSRRRVATP